ncbi:MAG: Gfo/Idh/MocA family oxidoreductase, partial [Planctomycetales bacterium]
MDSLRCVVIGCGRMGLAHAERLAADARSTLVGFYDSDQETAVQLRDRFAPDAPVFESADDAFSQANADAA